MHASTFSSSWLLALAAAPIVVVGATLTAATPKAPNLELPPELALPFTESRTPPSDCQWPHDFHLRDAMQTCSAWADLQVNERWMFGVRAEVVDHRMVDMTLTSIDHDCDHCFAWDDRGRPPREERARHTLEAVNACMRQELAKATFHDATCTLDVSWVIQNDW